MIKSIKLIRMLKPVDIKDLLMVKGILEIVKTDNSIINLDVIENIDYLFPEGEYILQLEQSPKFNRRLWEFKLIPGRSEIKFHRGNKSNHSKGCPLLTDAGLRTLHKELVASKRYLINVINIKL